MDMSRLSQVIFPNIHASSLNSTIYIPSLYLCLFVRIHIAHSRVTHQLMFAEVLPGAKFSLFESGASDPSALHEVQSRNPVLTEVYK